MSQNVPDFSLFLQERFRLEYETAKANRESIIMLKVRVVVGSDTHDRFYTEVVESALMLLLG